MAFSASSTSGSSTNLGIDNIAGARGLNNKLEGSWASKLLSSNNVLQEGWKLKQSSSAEQILDIPESLIMDVNDWGFCLVGFFVGPFPGMNAVDRLCKSWNVPFELMTHKSGWLIFKFKNGNDRASVMEQGPFNVYGRPLLLKILPQYFLFEEDIFNKVPLWIQISEIPIECWTPAILGMISSYVGNPICTDSTTSKLQRLSYARILVEVDITKPLVRNVSVRLPNGIITEVTITYEYEPKFCSNCKSIGHSSGNCKNTNNVDCVAVTGPAPNPIAGPKKWIRRSTSAKKDRGKQVVSDIVAETEKHVGRTPQPSRVTDRGRSKSTARNKGKDIIPQRGRSQNPNPFRDFIDAIDSDKETGAEQTLNQAFTLVKKKRNRKKGAKEGGLVPNHP